MRTIEKAIATAVRLHAGQTRKGNASTPYIIHPIETALIAARATSHEPAIVAALLHDTVEDCEYTVREIEAEFGNEVAHLVSLLTEEKGIADWRVRKEASLKKLNGNTTALFLKAADAISNIRSLRAALSEYGPVPVVWERFNAPKPEKLWYFRTILEAARDGLPPEMRAEYAGILKHLEQ